MTPCPFCASLSAKPAEWPDDWTPPPPAPDLQTAGEAMTAAECDEMLACIAAILDQVQRPGSTHAEMLRWKVASLIAAREALRDEDAHLQQERLKDIAHMEGAYRLWRESFKDLVDDRDERKHALRKMTERAEALHQEI